MGVMVASGQDAMGTGKPDSGTPRAKEPKTGKMTGRHFLYWIVSFFGVIFTVNGIFIYMALSTWSGLEVKNAYQVGRNYNKYLAAAEAQNKRGWKVDVTKRLAGDSLSVVVRPRDAKGAPLTGLEITVWLRRPTQEDLDRQRVLTEGETGRYSGVLPLPAKGLWQFILIAKRNGKEVYRSRSRVVLQ